MSKHKHAEARLIENTDKGLRYAKYCEVNYNWASREIVKLLREKGEIKDQLIQQQRRAKSLSDSVDALRTAKRGVDTKVCWMAINGAQSALKESNNE